MSRITVVGAGYVGLTTAAYLSHLGHEVICCDVDAGRVERLNSGEIPIHEPDLDDLVANGLANGSLVFVDDTTAAAKDAEFVFLCVPTPQGEDGSADLTYVEAAARQIGPVIASSCIVVNKSTVPVGSTLVVEGAMGREDVSVVSNPEFLREGSAVYDCLNPERIVIGSDNEEAARAVAGLFRKLEAPTIITDPASAETIKYASNAFLATKVSFINAMARVCEAVGADIKDVALAMGYDSRIGFTFLNPGPGWGGSCLPKDTKALVRIAEDAGYDFHLLRGVIAVNDRQYDLIVEKIAAAAGGSLQGKRIGVLGLTFKANTDDLRDSPSLFIIDRLLAAGADVVGYDITQARQGAPRHSTIEAIELSADPYAVADGADVLAILTEWDEYRWLDFEKIRELMNTPTIVDGRNLLDADIVRAIGFEYIGVGRP